VVEGGALAIPVAAAEASLGTASPPRLSMKRAVPLCQSQSAVSLVSVPEAPGVMVALIDVPLGAGAGVDCAKDRGVGLPAEQCIRKQLLRSKKPRRAL
jgi:hypothetical protein